MVPLVRTDRRCGKARAEREPVDDLAKGLALLSALTSALGAAVAALVALSAFFSRRRLEKREEWLAMALERAGQPEVVRQAFRGQHTVVLARLAAASHFTLGPLTVTALVGPVSLVPLSQLGYLLGADRHVPP